VLPSRIPAAGSASPPLALELHDIHHAFDTPGGMLHVLEGISFQLRAGSWLSLIGPSGCGKTTILKIATGLLLPTSGQVLQKGQIGIARGTIGYMPQSDTLLPWRTAVDNAALAAEAQGRSRPASRVEAYKLLEQSGLAEFSRAFPSELSGGMRQRIALVRTLLAGRELLLLDEPLGALDALTRTAMQTWLTDLLLESQRTVLLVTHDIEEAALMSDAVLVLSARPSRVTQEIALPSRRPRRPWDREVVEARASVLSSMELKGRVE